MKKKFVTGYMPGDEDEDLPTTDGGTVSSDEEVEE